MIKIITGFSNAGGSTVAFINLTNKLNESGLDCTFFGPHQYHLNKCKADTMANISLREDDSLIIHFFKTNWVCRPPIKGKIIYSCHEKDISPIRNMNYKIFDKIHYVSKQQMKWHNVDYPNFILPNIIDDLKPSNSVVEGREKISAIIGSIDRNKQVHISIQRALEDGIKKVLLFGNISDQQYYNSTVKPLIDGSKVMYMDHCDNKQEMYDQITDVYHSSLSETWGYIEKECELTGVCYHGSGATKDNFDVSLTNDEIIEEWLKELEL